MRNALLHSLLDIFLPGIHEPPQVEKISKLPPGNYGPASRQQETDEETPNSQIKESHEIFFYQREETLVLY
jgi:hypothetical protein